MDLRSREVRQPVLRAVNHHMANHYGLIDHATAEGLGASRHVIEECLDSGMWVPVHRGIYRSAAAPGTREQDLLAAVLAGGPDAVASHRSAVWLWGLFAAPPQLPEIAVPYERTMRQRGIAIHRSTDLVGLAPSLRRGIPVTPPARSILDVSAVVPPHVIDLVVDRAVATKLITVPVLLATLDQFGRRGRRGAGKLRKALEARGVAAPTHAPSVLESAMARLLKQLNIAPPVAEFVVAGGRFRFDFAWPDILFALEVHGWVAHSAFADWARDIEKRNWAAANGWDLYEATWDDVTKRPEVVATEIMRRIRRRALAA